MNTFLLIFAALSSLLAAAHGHSGPPTSFTGRQGPFSKNAPTCNGGSSNAAPMVPLGSCVQGRMIGFPNQCRAMTGNPQATLQANTNMQFPLSIVALHDSTCGYIHLTANNDIMDSSKWINLTPDGAFCIRQGNGRFTDSVTVRIPDVAPGMYNVCFLGYGGVLQQVDSRYPNTAQQHHAYHSCKEVRINNANPGNFVAQAMYPVNMGRIYIGNQIPRAVFMAQDGYTGQGDNASGRKRREYLQQRIAGQGPVSYCAADGRLHKTGNAAQACSAPVWRAPHVHPNQCNEYGPSQIGGPGPAPGPAPAPPTPPAPAPNNCQNAEYSQCGGKGYTGRTCCPSTATCFRLNEFYSQCVPKARLQGVVATYGDSVQPEASGGLPVGALAGAGAGLAALLVVGAVMTRRKENSAAPASAQGSVVPAGAAMEAHNKQWMQGSVI